MTTVTRASQTPRQPGRAAVAAAAVDSVSTDGAPQRDWPALGRWLIFWLTVGCASLAARGLLPT